MPSGRAVAWARLRVTVVVVVSLVILTVVVYLLTGGTLLQEKSTIYLYVPDATGIVEGTPVRVNGIAVGTVDKVMLSGSSQPDRIVKLTLKVEREHLKDIPQDSYAQLSSEGAIGDRYVDITQGKSAARIQPTAEIVYKAEPDFLKTIDIQQFNQQLRIMDATLTDIEQGKNRVGQLIVGTEMYADLRRQLSEAERGFREATSTTSAVGQLLYSDELYRRISDPLVQLDESLGRIQGGQGALGKMVRDDSQYVQFHDEITNLRASITNLRGQRFLTADDLYDSWSRGLAGMIQRIDDINAGPLFSSSMTYDNFAGFARELQTTLSDFRRDPKKYMRLKLF